MENIAKIKAWDVMLKQLEEWVETHPDDVSSAKDLYDMREAFNTQKEELNSAYFYAEVYYDGVDNVDVDVVKGVKVPFDKDDQYTEDYNDLEPDDKPQLYGGTYIDLIVGALARPKLYTDEDEETS